MKKRILSIILAIILVVSCATGALATGRFSDVPENAWYRDYVYSLAADGIISGFADGTFKPDDPVTYGQALKLIFLASGFSEQPATGSHWASGYLNLAVALGMVGSDVDVLTPVTRSAIAHIAADALGLRTNAPSPFADTDDPACVALYQTGIITGSVTENGLLFNGDHNLKRSEISAIVYRIKNTNFDTSAEENDERDVVTEILPGMTHILVDCTGYLNIRESADINSAVVGKIPAGRTAELFGVENGWYHVCYRDVIGYVSADYCSQVDYEVEISAEISDMRSQIVEFAKQFTGVPYVYGGASPSGFDCSGFTMYVMQQFGIGLSHGARAQYASCTPLERSELLPGDLVFFSNSSTSWIGHAGIYIGSGLFIHASSGSCHCVTISSLSSSWYANHYIAGGRVIYD